MRSSTPPPIKPAPSGATASAPEPVCARTPVALPDDPFPLVPPFEPPLEPPCELVLVGEAVDDGVPPPGAELVGVEVVVPDGGHGVVGGGGGGGGQPQPVGVGVG